MALFFCLFFMKEKTFNLNNDCLDYLYNLSDQGGKNKLATASAFFQHRADEL